MKPVSLYDSIEFIECPHIPDDTMYLIDMSIFDTLRIPPGLMRAGGSADDARRMRDMFTINVAQKMLDSPFRWLRVDVGGREYDTTPDWPEFWTVVILLSLTWLALVVA